MTQSATRASRSEINTLLQLSTRIGRDPLLVHASSGNTSLKLDGTLWIKASGKWLAYADQEEILVPVEMTECLECLKEGLPLAARNGRSRATSLRPSIETLMHAALPQRFVIHVHSVNTIAWAVRPDAPVHLAERLSGLRWQWIPYVPSGLALAQAVQSASFTRPDTDIFILGNHGLVVCGNNCSGTETILFEVHRRLATPPRPAPKPDSGFLARVQGLPRWRLPHLETLHTLGTDLISLRIIKGGTLYPCQAIFLGRELPVLSDTKDPCNVMNRIQELDAALPFLIIEGSGILVNDEITAAEYAVLNGFAEVVRRIETTAPIRYLTDHEVNSVLNTDGQNYRMSAENNGRRSIAPS